MADKTIGQLTKAAAMTDETLIPVEQNGVAQSLSGALLREFCENATNNILGKFVDVSEEGM
jgi:hypothetical protein